jgi:multidrug efflux system membrane fusion protein
LKLKNVEFRHMSSISLRTILRARLVAAPVLLLGAALALSACQQQTARAPEPIRPVKVMKVEANAATRQIVLSGSVKARTEAGLGFRVPGKIVERLVNVGDHVEPGAVLARLDTNDLDLALNNAESSVGSAKARRDVAEKALARNKALFAKAFIAQSVLDQQQLEFDQADAALTAAISTRDQARNQTAYSELKADAAGIVTEIRAEVGQVVSAGAPVVVVARDGAKEVAIAVPENEIRHFTAGEKLKARFWADDAIALTGAGREISGSADPASRTFAVRVSLPEDARVRLGMTATLSADVPVDGSAIVMPLAALSERDGKPIVWVVDPANQTVAPRNVETESFAPGGVRIAQGLAGGELVVTAGTQFMTPDKKVRIADAPAVATAAATVATR